MIKISAKKVGAILSALIFLTAIGCGKPGDKTGSSTIKKTTHRDISQRPAGVTVYRSRKESKEVVLVRYLLHRTAQKCLIAQTYMKAILKFKPGKNGSVAQFNELMQKTRAAYDDAQRAVLVTNYYAIGLIHLERQKRDFSLYAMQPVEQNPFYFSGTAYAASDDELKKVYDNAKLGQKLQSLAEAMGTKDIQAAKNFIDRQPAKYQNEAQVYDTLHKAQSVTNAGLKTAGLVGTAIAVGGMAATATPAMVLAGGVAFTVGVVDTGLSYVNTVFTLVNDDRGSESLGNVMLVTGIANTVAGGAYNIAGGISKGYNIKEIVISCFKDDKSKVLDASQKGINMLNNPGTALSELSKGKNVSAMVDGVNTVSWYIDRGADANNIFSLMSDSNKNESNNYSTSINIKNLSGKNKKAMEFCGTSTNQIEKLSSLMNRQRELERKATWQDYYRQANSWSAANINNSGLFNNIVNNVFGNMVRTYGGNPNTYNQHLKRLFEAVLKLANINNAPPNIAQQTQQAPFAPELVAGKYKAGFYANGSKQGDLDLVVRASGKTLIIDIKTITCHGVVNNYNPQTGRGTFTHGGHNNKTLVKEVRFFRVNEAVKNLFRLEIHAFDDDKPKPKTTTKTFRAQDINLGPGNPKYDRAVELGRQRAQQKK